MNHSFTRQFDSHRLAVWELFADQFLDTEVRTWIPSVAAACVAAGYSVAEARYIWRFEVTPAVYFNLWDLAGEWAGWDLDWLVKRIQKLRGRWPNRPGWATELVYRMRVHYCDCAWIAIEKCILLLKGSEPEQRELLTTDLTSLAECFFDFQLPDYNPSDSTRQRLRRLYRETFLPIFEPLAVTCEITKETPEACRERLVWMISRTTSRT